MKNMQKGFTLIELMIVVAIIGILAAIAIPAYQDYTVRAQVSEGPELAAGIKSSIADYYADRGTWPADMAALGITGTIQGKYVATITQAAGVITITYGNQANATALGANTRLDIRPATSTNGDIAWVCGRRAVPSATLTAVGADGTTVENKYLPSVCRA